MFCFVLFFSFFCEPRVFTFHLRKALPLFGISKLPTPLLWGFGTIVKRRKGYLNISTAPRYSNAGIITEVVTEVVTK